MMRKTTLPSFDPKAIANGRIEALIDFDKAVRETAGPLTLDNITQVQIIFARLRDLQHERDKTTSSLPSETLTSQSSKTIYSSRSQIV